MVKERRYQHLSSAMQCNVFDELLNLYIFDVIIHDLTLIYFLQLAIYQAPHPSPTSQPITNVSFRHNLSSLFFPFKARLEADQGAPANSL